MIREIVIMDEQQGIARAGAGKYDIPFDIPDDRRYFKEKTQGSIVIMGRHTYDKYDQPLPNRRNIVVSRTLSDVRDGFEVCHDLQGLLNGITKDIWIIGGAELYNAALANCDELYITHVEGNFSCDKFFPQFSSKFSLDFIGEPKQQNGLTYHYGIYTKNR